MPNLKLTRRTLTSLPKVDKTTVFYDTDLKGFGLKAFPSGVLYHGSWNTGPARVAEASRNGGWF